MRAWGVFAILFALMVVNFVDRQVVVSMFPHLKADWRLDDGELGALVSIVSVVVGLGAVPLAYLADRYGRVASVIAMALVWSLATVACAFAQDYGQLFLARGVVGLGEAAYGAVGAALVASLFPSQRRSTVIATFLAAATLGSMLGVVMGGAVAEQLGWRAGFAIAGVPGVALALVLAWIARGERRRDQGSSPLRVRGALALLRNRTLAIACAGAGLQGAVIATVFAWLPSYFHRHGGVGPAEAGAQAGVVVLVAGIGAIAWGYVADRLATSTPRARLHVPVAGVLASAALLALAFGAMGPGPLQYAAILAGAFAMTAALGPVTTVAVDVVPAAWRATSAGLLSLAQNLFGFASGPLVAGWLSDAYGLPFALAAVPVCGVAAAALFALAASGYERDLARVSREVDGGNLVPMMGR